MDAIMRPLCLFCGKPSTMQCDARHAPGYLAAGQLKHSGLACGAPMCDRCSSDVGWRHLCPDHTEAYELQRKLINALKRALPILRQDRDSLLQCHTLSDANGEPDRATLDENARDDIEAYDAAIAAAEDAIGKAGVL